MRAYPLVCGTFPNGAEFYFKNDLTSSNYVFWFETSQFGALGTSGQGSFSVTSSPEPGTALMLLAGFALLVLWRQSHKIAFTPDPDTSFYADWPNSNL